MAEFFVEALLLLFWGAFVACVVMTCGDALKTLSSKFIFVDDRTDDEKADEQAVSL